MSVENAAWHELASSLATARCDMIHNINNIRKSEFKMWCGVLCFSLGVFLIVVHMSSIASYLIGINVGAVLGSTLNVITSMRRLKNFPHISE